jgi:hypothetical protein
MNSSDREIVSSLLQAAGLHHPYARERRLNLGTKFDRHGKVTELTLGYSKVVENGRNVASFWDLPASIGELHKLRKLVLCHCQSLPPSICRLRNLEVLELHSCRPFPTDNDDDDDTIILPSLTKLEHHEGTWDPQSMEDWMRWICRKNSMPKLQHLHFSSLQDNLLDPVVDVLSHKAFEESIPFRNNLRHFAWIHCEMSDHGLQRLLLEVVPLYPHLSTVNVIANQIKSLQFLLPLGKAWKAILTEQQEQSKTANYYPATRVNNNNILPTYSYSLQILNLQHNPIMKKRTSHPLEEQAFQLLLQEYFPFLGSLSTWDDWDPPIEYLLRINRGGRVLVEGNRPLAKKDIKTNDKTPDRIPLSLWPHVLELAYKTSPRGFLPKREDATALFYLIRNGPVLTEIMAGSR